MRFDYTSVAKSVVQCSSSSFLSRKVQNQILILFLFLFSELAVDTFSLTDLPQMQVSRSLSIPIRSIQKLCNHSKSCKYCYNCKFKNLNCDHENIMYLSFLIFVVEMRY